MPVYKEDLNVALGVIDVVLVYIIIDRLIKHSTRSYGKAKILWGTDKKVETKFLSFFASFCSSYTPNSKGFESQLLRRKLLFFLITQCVSVLQFFVRHTKDCVDAGGE